MLSHFRYKLPVTLSGRPTYMISGTLSVQVAKYVGYAFNFF
jgi:hypothetical protein